MFMRTALRSTTAISLLFGALLALSPTPASAAQSCVSEEFDGARYSICTIETADNLQLFWDDAEGAPYRSFSAVSNALEAEGRTLRFAVNAGMYDTNFKPLGLYIEDGAQKVRISTANPGQNTQPVPNFLKKPNGVFYVDQDGAAGILTTEAYVEAALEPRIATQSGPMLVIDGEFHPMLIPGSTDRTPRSGVGVCENGAVRFAVSDGRVNFHDFARLFRDHLGCSNALFLDGGRGVGLHSPDLGRNDFSWHGGYGPMFGVVD